MLLPPDAETLLFPFDQSTSWMLPDLQSQLKNHLLVLTQEWLDECQFSCELIGCVQQLQTKDHQLEFCQSFASAASTSVDVVVKKSVPPATHNHCAVDCQRGFKGALHESPC